MAGPHQELAMRKLLPGGVMDPGTGFEVIGGIGWEGERETLRNQLPAHQWWLKQNLHKCWSKNLPKHL